MISEATVTTIERYWAQHMATPVEQLFVQPANVVTHGGKLADYNGIFAIFRGEGATVSVPAGRADWYRQTVRNDVRNPDRFAEIFLPLGLVVIGPAYVGYTDFMGATKEGARRLNDSDASAIDTLRAACSTTEWEHGGCDLDEQECAGVFVDGELMSLAGFEVWGDSIAQIRVVTQPALRGRGLGRCAVGEVARMAIERGLVPQYRTLESNRASKRVAESLGFVKFASSVAVRLGSLDDAD